MPERISAVIATYNGADWIEECLDSIREGAVGEVVVVDNASTDDTVSRVKRYGEFVKLIELHRNLGFGRANNVGIQMALDGSAQYVCLLNQDMIVCPGAIALLVESLEKTPDFAMAGAFQLLLRDDRIDPVFRGCIPPDFWDDLLLRTPGELYEVRVVFAAAVVLRRADLFLVGGFDPLFFMYGEDEDFCDRLRKAGRKIGVVPKARSPLARAY